MGLLKTGLKAAVAVKTADLIHERVLARQQEHAAAHGHAGPAAAQPAAPAAPTAPARFIAGHGATSSRSSRNSVSCARRGC